jgi:outer membrane immunogenic protein
MKKCAVASLACAALALASGAAVAADMPAKAPIYTKAPPVAVYSWTGFYVGGNAGYGWGDANDEMTLGGLWPTDGSGDNLSVGPLGNRRLRPTGFTGGVEAGYNYQVGSWVWGIEADWEYFGLKDNFSATVTAASGDPYAFASSYKSNWLVTVRPRLGYAFDQFLVYATGGLAISDQTFSQNITQLNVAFVEGGAVSKTTAGWTAGAGTEYALDNRWRMKAEYLYVDPGSGSFSSAGIGPPGSNLYNATHSAHLKANIVRGGINYKFW